MKILQYSLLTLALATAAMPSIQAQELPLKRAYTKADLERFWNNMVAKEATDASFYRILLEGMDQTSGSGSRLDSVWTDDNSQTQKATFLIEPLPSTNVGKLARRELALNLYMNRDDYYEVPTATTADTDTDFRNKIISQQNYLGARRQQAAYELFLIGIARYREASTLGQKCNALRAADQNYKLAQKQSYASDLKDAFRDIIDYADSIKTKYATQLSKQIPCKARLPSSTDQSLTAIEQKANQLVAAAIRKQHDSKIVPIKDLSDGTFEPLLERVYAIDPMSGKLYDFESRARSAKATINIVDGDAYGLGAQIRVLDGINYDELRNKPIGTIDPAPITRVIAAKLSLHETTMVFLNRLAQFHQLAPADQKSRFTDCVGLDTAFKNLWPAYPTTWNVASTFNYSETNGNNLVRKVTTCLDRAKELLSSLTKADRNAALGEQFAKSLNELTVEYIRVTN